VVGVTDYCVSPAQFVARLPKVGGPKDARIEAICDLRPDLVIASRDENPRALAEGLQARGVPVWALDVRSVADSLLALRQIATIFESDRANLQLDLLEKSVEWVAATYADQPRWTYFCPVWQDASGSAPWWMTFNRGTYSHRLLALFGGENVFARRERRYPLAADLGDGPAEDPGERDARYPRLSGDEVALATFDTLLLPDEPFAFSEQDCDSMSRRFARCGLRRALRIDGSLITWYGTRLGRALTELPPVLFE
jgi:hypothetical protein